MYEYEFKSSVIFDDLSDHYPVLLLIKLGGKIDAPVLRIEKLEINESSSTKFLELIGLVQWSDFV